MNAGTVNEVSNEALKSHVFDSTGRTENMKSRPPTVDELIVSINREITEASGVSSECNTMLLGSSPEMGLPVEKQGGLVGELSRIHSRLMQLRQQIIVTHAYLGGYNDHGH